MWTGVNPWSSAIRIRSGWHYRERKWICATLPFHHFTTLNIYQQRTHWKYGSNLHICKHFLNLWLVMHQWQPFAQWRHVACQNILPDHSWKKLYVNIQENLFGRSLNKLWGVIRKRSITTNVVHPFNNSDQSIMWAGLVINVSDRVDIIGIELEFLVDDGFLVQFCFSSALVLKRNTTGPENFHLRTQD